MKVRLATIRPDQNMEIMSFIIVSSPEHEVVKASYYNHPTPVFFQRVLCFVCHQLLAH